jgi:hypothetical protein
LKRNPADVLRRGFDNAVANWPLLLVRFAESLVILFIVIASIFALVVPLIVSAGLSHFDRDSGESPAEIVATLLAEHWMIFVYLIFLVTVVSLVLLAIHCFVVAGTARVLVDAERAAGPAPPTRDRFRLFSIDHFMAGGRRGFWPVFWIYNVTYGVAALITLAPLMLFALLALAFATIAWPLAAGLGCLGLLVTILAAVISMMGAAIWTQKATVVCTERRSSGNDALRIAWREIAADFARHFIVTIVMVLIGVGVSGVFNAVSVILSGPTMLPHNAGAAFTMMFLPARFAISSLGGIAGAAVSLWFTACFAALSEKP